MILKNWKAKPAGGRMTIDGELAATGRPVKLSGVTQLIPATDKETRFFGLITVETPYVVAINDSGRHRLEF